MEKRLYHGSATPGIVALEPRSRLHGTAQQVVYLTDCVPYALLYIWNTEKHCGAGKHVTAWVENGVVHYEEQFPDQLKTFYQGVSGYVYCISDTEDIQAVENRKNMFYYAGDAAITESIYIPDVYEELLRYEAEGKFVILRYNEQSAERQNELIDFIAQGIIHEGFYTANKEKQKFMKKHFSKAWEKAELLR